MFYNGLIPGFNREQICQEAFLLVLDLELSTFKTRERCSACKGYDAQIEDIDNSRIVENVHIPSQITSDVVDELVK